MEAVVVLVIGPFLKITFESPKRFMQISQNLARILRPEVTTTERHAAMHKGRKMAGLSLNIADGMWCVWLKGVYASDYQQTTQTILAILGWLTQPRIENLMRFAPLTSVDYKRNIVNRWFSLGEGKRQQQDVKVIHVDENGKLHKCYTTQNAQAFPESLSNEKYEVFFHGTRHTSAENIIENNIDVERGAEGNDFSTEGGFYVCKDFDVALDTKWAINRPPCSAVLVFRVQSDELRSAKMNSLDLRVNSKRWEEVVRLFRIGEDDQKFPKERKDDLEKLDFIEGPIFSGQKRFSIPMPIGDSYQLCVKSDTCAKLFDQSLHSVVFFPEKKKLRQKNCGKKKRIRKS